MWSTVPAVTDVDSEHGLSPPFVSIVVPVRNGERTVEDCIVSLLRMDYPSDRREILVVDNGSRDGTVRIIRRHPVTCLSEIRRGPAPARNRGIEASHGEIIAFTDADCVVEPSWLSELVRGFSENSVSAVAGEVIAYPPRTRPERYMALKRPCWQKAALASDRPYIVTANVAFRRQTFERIGLFDPRFLTGEDQDFGWRFFRAGLGLRYCAAAVVRHRHRETCWTFLRQQMAWASGSASLRAHYDLPRGARRELSQFRALGVAAIRLMSAVARRTVGGEGAEISHALFDVLREAARGVGRLHFALQTSSSRLPLVRARSEPRDVPGCRESG